MVLGARARLVLKLVGYPLFGLLSFLVCFYITFPYERLRLVIEDHLAASGEMEVRIGEVGPSPLLGVTLTDVRVTLTPRARPTYSPVGLQASGGDAAAPARKEKPARLWIEELSVNTGLFALIQGAIDVDFSLRGLGGEVSGSYTASKAAGWSLELEVEGVKLDDVPQVAEAVGLPVQGRLSGKVELIVPLNRWSEASGLIELSGADCVIGDGKAMLKIPGNPMLAMGVTLPRVRIGTIEGRVGVTKGVATVERMTARSPDIDMAMDATVNLREPVAFSMVQGYLRFKLSPTLKQRDAKFELVENGMSNARRADGYFGLRLTGSLKRLQPIPSAVEPSTGGRRGLGRPGAG
jgi:type II secretion system protein N